MLKPFWLALGFLTRLPVPALEDIDVRDQGRSMVCYPIVGGIIGALLSLIALYAPSLAPAATAAMILVVWVLITGGIHLDGLADSADGWLGGHGDRERTLEIMKDSRAGAAAVILVVLLLIFKFAMVYELIRLGAWQAFVIAPVLGRAGVLVLFISTPYARPGGMGDVVHQHLNRSATLLAVGASILLGILLVWETLIPALILIAVVFFAMRRMMMKTLNGTTGDTAGALIEVLEAVTLMGFLWGTLAG